MQNIKYLIENIGRTNDVDAEDGVYEYAAIQSVIDHFLQTIINVLNFLAESEDYELINPIGQK